MAQLKRGLVPTPRHRLASALPYHPLLGAPPNFLLRPQKLSFWGNNEHGDCVTAEEAFAKACNNPEIFISDDVVINWAKSHGVLDGAYITQVMDWMQNDGFAVGSNVYDDGPYTSVDWTSASTLQSAISRGPVKIGIAADQLEKAYTWKDGWFAIGFKADAAEDHATALCGYGTISWLAAQLGVQVPAGVDGSKPGYAMFTWSTIGIIDEPSLLAITHEAWLRQPSTVTKSTAPHQFQGRPAVFPTDAAKTKKSIYAVTGDGKLAQLWDTDKWNFDFPASDMKFQGSPAVFPRAQGKKSIYSVTADGRLAQLWDTDVWNMDFPAELAGQGGLKFQSGVAVYPTDVAANKKSIYGVTVDGRLAQVWDTDKWNLDFPVEATGQNLKFQGIPTVFPTTPGKKSIYAVTDNGRLAQVFDTNVWNIDFPAELAGQGNLKFQQGVAVFPREGGAKKSIYGITVDGRLVQMVDTNVWNLDFPIETTGMNLKLQGIPAVFPTSVDKKAIYAVTTDGRLAQIWDTDKWNIDFPAELAGRGDLKFVGSPAVFPSANGKKSIYVRTNDGRLAQIWDTDHWNLDFPAEAL